MAAKKKEYLCKTCGEKDPDKFYLREKGMCKVCFTERQRCYYKKNAEYILDRKKQYHQDNKEAISDKKKKYQQDNKEAIRVYQEKYRQDNKEAISDQKKHYYQQNKKYVNEREKERRNTDPALKYMQNLRSRQRHVLKGRISTTEFLGCTSQELKDHFESLFQEGMTHENHGEWHMDHIIPLSTAEKNDKGEPIDSDYNRMLFHYTNLQPLWKKDNLKKGKKL